jgi:hypothetical protein
MRNDFPGTVRDGLDSALSAAGASRVRDTSSNPTRTGNRVPPVETP